MNICMRKNCQEEIYEEGFCAKHYNEIVKKIIQDMDKVKTDKVEEEDNASMKEEISTKAQFLLFSLLAHVDKFTDSLISSFNDLFNLSEEETAKIYHQMSDKLVEKKDSKKAISVLKKVVELNQSDPESKFELGSAYLAAGLFEKANECFEEAIKLSPDNYTYHLKRGFAYEQRELWDKAVASYEKAIKINPDDSEIYYRLGVIYNNIEKFKGAIASITKAIELKPEQADYHQRLGIVYESLEQHKEAAECFKKAISLQQESS